MRGYEKESRLPGSVADPGSRIQCLFDPLDPGSGMGKNSGSGSGMLNPDHNSESLETIFLVKILKFFYADPGSGIFLTLNPGWENFGSVIRDKHPAPGSATLLPGLRSYFSFPDGIRFRRQL